MTSTSGTLLPGGAGSTSGNPSKSGAAFQSDPASASFQTRAYVQQALRSVTHAKLHKELVGTVQHAKDAADQQLKDLIRDHLGTFMDSQDAMRSIIGADRQLFSGEALQAIIAVFDDERAQCEDLVEPILSVHQQLQVTHQIRELLAKFQTITSVPSVVYRSCGVRVAALGEAHTPAPHVPRGSTVGRASAAQGSRAALDDPDDREEMELRAGISATGSGGVGRSAAPSPLQPGEELIWWFGTPLARPADPDERQRRREGGRSGPGKTAPTRRGGNAQLDVAVLHFRRALLFLEEHYDLERGVWRNDGEAAGEEEAFPLSGGGNVAAEEDDPEEDDPLERSEERLKGSTLLTASYAFTSTAHVMKSKALSSHKAGKESRMSRERTHIIFLFHYTAALLRSALFLQDHLGNDHLRHTKPSDTVSIEDLLHMMMELALGTVKLKGFARALSHRLGRQFHHLSSKEAAMKRLRTKLITQSLAANGTPECIPFFPTPRGGNPNTIDGNSTTAGSAAAPLPGDVSLLWNPPRGISACSPPGFSSRGAGASQRTGDVWDWMVLQGSGTGSGGDVRAGFVGGLWHPVQYYVEITRIQFEQMVEDRARLLCRRATEVLDRWEEANAAVDSQGKEPRRPSHTICPPTRRMAPSTSPCTATTSAAEGQTADSAVKPVGKAPPGDSIGTATLPVSRRPANLTIQTEEPGALSLSNPSPSLSAVPLEEAEEGVDEEELVEKLGVAALLEGRGANSPSVTEAQDPVKLAEELLAAFQPHFSSSVEVKEDLGMSALDAVMSITLPIAGPLHTSVENQLDATPVLVASTAEATQHLRHVLEKLQDRTEIESNLLSTKLHTDACQLVSDTVTSLEQVISHYWAGIAQSIHNGMFDFTPSTETVLGRLLQQEIALASEATIEPNLALDPVALLHSGRSVLGTSSRAVPTTRAGGRATSMRGSEFSPEAQPAQDFGGASTISPSARHPGSLVGDDEEPANPAAAVEAGERALDVHAARLPELHFVPLLVQGHVPHSRPKHNSKTNFPGHVKATATDRSRRMPLDGDLDDDDDEEDTEPTTLRGYSVLRVCQMLRDVSALLERMLAAFINQCMVRVFYQQMEAFTVADLVENDKDEQIELCAAVIVEVLLGQWEQCMAIIADGVLRIKISIGESFSAASETPEDGVGVAPHSAAERVRTAMLDVSKVLSELEAFRSRCFRRYLRGVGMLLNAYISLFPSMHRTGDTTLERRVRPRLSRQHLSSNACNKLLNTLSVLLDRTTSFLHRHAEVYHSEEFFSTSREKKKKPLSSQEGRLDGPSETNEAETDPAIGGVTAQMARFHQLLVVEHVEQHGRDVMQLCSDLHLTFVDMIHAKTLRVCGGAAVAAAAAGQKREMERLEGVQQDESNVAWREQLSYTVARQREVVECMADILCLTGAVLPLFLTHLLSPCLLALRVSLDPEIPVAERQAELRRAELNFEEDERVARVGEHAQLVLSAILQMHLVGPTQRITKIVYESGFARPDVDWQRVSRHTAGAVRPYLGEALAVMAEANEALYWVQQPLLAAVVTQQLLVHLSQTMMTGMTVDANFVELLTPHCSTDFVEHGTLLLEAEVQTVFRLLQYVAQHTTPHSHVQPELPAAMEALTRWYRALLEHHEQMYWHQKAQSPSGGGSVSASMPLLPSHASGIEGEAEAVSKRAHQGNGEENHEVMLERRQVREEKRNAMVREALTQLEYMLDVMMASPWVSSLEGTSTSSLRYNGRDAHAGEKAATGAAVPSAVTEGIVQRLAKRLESGKTNHTAPPPPTTQASGKGKAATAAGPHARMAIPQDSGAASAPERGRRGSAVLLHEPISQYSSANETEKKRSTLETSFVFPARVEAAPPALTLEPAGDEETPAQEEQEQAEEEQALDDATRLYLQVVRKGQRLLANGGEGGARHRRRPGGAQGGAAVSTAPPPTTAAPPESASTLRGPSNRRRSVVEGEGVAAAAPAGRRTRGRFARSKAV